jgi:Secretion system C-terminal sorting domain
MNMKYNITGIILPFLFAFNICQAQHTNILISNSNSPSEPSIIFNHKSPRYMVAGANLRANYYSSDSGRTWTQGLLTSTYGVWGDPTILIDTAGNFYYFHLSNPTGISGGSFIDRIVCQKSFDNGQTWTAGTFTGKNGAKAQDKQWGTIDPVTNNIYLTWSQFDVYGSSNPNDSSHIMFSRSLDGGNTWSNARRINTRGGDCVDGDNTVEGAVPAVGPSGQLYVAWAGIDGLYFNKSGDFGATWLPQSRVIAPIPGGWDYSIPGVDRCNGLPVTVCDRSESPNKGTIYINWTDQRNGVNNTDVWLIKSTDAGNSWSTPVRVNDDNSNRHQFLTWMAIDQSNGYLYFVYYDRRNHADNNTDVYMARSTDGGQTFVNFKVSQNPFSPNAGVFFGDYTNVYAHENVVRPIWGTNSGSGTNAIWTALVNTSIIASPTGINDPVADANELKHYPNPFSNETFISFKIRQRSSVSVEIYDNMGRMVYQPLSNKTYNYGKYTERIDFGKTQLPSGNYFLQLRVNNNVSKRKMIYVGR